MLTVSSYCWLRSFSVLATALAGWIVLPVSVWAQAITPEIRDRFLSDPEFTEPRDPLLPELPIVRPLSPLERSALEADLDRLAVEAEGLYLRGQTDGAFALWMREVRLRRILSFEQELQTIQKVSVRAWESSRTPETQLLTARLQQIQALLLRREPPDTAVLEQVAAAFEVLRDIDSAVAVYGALIEQAQQADDRLEQQRLLEKLASLEESWFRFEAAGETYQALLSTLNPGREDLLKRQQYLKGAIRNYQDAGQLKRAITYQRQLLKQYEETAQVQPAPALLLAIARNYRTLEDLPQAQAFYRVTYTAALALNQSSFASDAIQDLTDIYLGLERFTDVQYLFEQQIAVDSLSYNAYGIMQAFERLGRLYEAEENLDAAITLYQEALILASHLGHREIFFKRQLQQLLRDQGRLTIIPATQHESRSPVGNLDRPTVWNENRRVGERL